MGYEDRLRQYEAEKRRIMATATTPSEYQQLIKAAAKKWRI